MFNWPILSAAVGISSNLFFLGVICALSWFHLTRSKEDETGDTADFDLFQGDLDGNISVEIECNQDHQLLFYQNCTKTK